MLIKKTDDKLKYVSFIKNKTKIP